MPSTVCPPLHPRPIAFRRLRSLNGRSMGQQEGTGLCLQNCPHTGEKLPPLHSAIFQWLRAHTPGVSGSGLQVGRAGRPGPPLALHGAPCFRRENLNWPRLFISASSICLVFMEIPPLFWQQAPVSLGCQHRELSLLAAFLGILAESWGNMSQGLLLWCQLKSTTPTLFLLQLHLLFHSLAHSINKHVWST